MMLKKNRILLQHKIYYQLDALILRYLYGPNVREIVIDCIGGSKGHQLVLCKKLNELEKCT